MKRDPRAVALVALVLGVDEDVIRSHPSTSIEQRAAFRFACADLRAALVAELVRVGRLLRWRP